ncbi:hypothetical protein Nepgr_011811 [Nepenthes gracilis]|uniref:F-box protein n=1 Tax=Nepenthes gracilis TaxID=150966 RepID=A0AAD3SFS2_NEPGR|nr:hypothetical protein Nepgr_011811 [Nepenthes gracilis]
MNSSATGDGCATAFSDIHPDIIETNILALLDGSSLAALACVSAQIRRLSSDLMSQLCHRTWPSTDTPRLHHVIASFPSGPLSFFSLSFPLLLPTPRLDHHPPSPPQQLISAVDIAYRGKIILSSARETETDTARFRCSPFRINLLEQKDVGSTPIRKQTGGDSCKDLYGGLTLSWIMIDPVGRRAVNLSSFSPVSVQRRWWSGEVQARFATIIAGETGLASEQVMCVVEVTCAEGDWEELHVREVSMRMEDIDGIHLDGKKSLVILQTGFEGKRVNRRGRKQLEMKRRYEEFQERKILRRETKSRMERRLDMLCASFTVLTFLAAFSLLIVR